MIKKQNFQVLAIDDEPFILEIIEAYLTDKGFDVSLAKNGKEGLDLFKSKHFDLVLTDLYMPIMNGLQVLEALGKESPDTPVIVVSGAGGLQDSIEALRLGAWDYVMKPLDFSVLTHQISKAMERSVLLKENKLYKEGLEKQIKKRTAQLDKRTTELEAANDKLTNEIQLKEKVQVELQQAANQWQTTFDSMTDFISVHDKDYKIVKANRALSTYLNTNAQNLIGKKCCDIFHNECDPIKTCPHARTLKGGATESTEVDDDFGVPLLVTTSPIYLDGQIIGSVHVAKDITEQRRIEEERQKTKNLESIAGLAGGLAHDFNNLLAALVGYIDLARMESNPASHVYEMLENAKKVTKMASGLTQQLLTFSKGGSPIIKEVSLADLVEDCLNHIPCSQESIEPKITLPDDLKMVRGDKGQLRIVLNNLLYNAMESMPEGGSLYITCDNILRDGELQEENNPKDSVRLIVEDCGHGIKPENLKRIFDPYFTTKSMNAEKGQGLGLAVCYSIINKHNGEISITSDVGVGTKVSIRLPASLQ